MNLQPFDEDPRHRLLVPQSPFFAELFQAVAVFVRSRLPTVSLVHVGSTAIPGILTKPMLDLLVLTSEPKLRVCQQQLVDIGFHRRQIWVDQDDKPYLCGAMTWQGSVTNLHLHICHDGDGTHRNLVRFRDGLRSRPDLCAEYAAAKERAHQIDPIDPKVYNQEKEPIIRKIMAAIVDGSA